MASLEESILARELDDDNVIDAQFTTRKRSRIKPLYVGIGLALLVIPCGLVLLNNYLPNKGTVEPAILKSKSAAPPVGIDLHDAAPANAPVTPSTEQLPSIKEAIPLVDIQTKKTDASTDVKPASMPPILTDNIQAPVPSSSETTTEVNKKLAELESKITKLSGDVAELSSQKSMNVVAQPAMQTPAIKPIVSPPEKPKASIKQEVKKTAAELQIVTVLTDGIVFSGDIAVPVGQYAKQLGGKIVSISSDQTTITTDSKIYKVVP